MQIIPKHVLPGAALLLFCGIQSASANIVIDHTDIQLVPSYSQSTMDAIAQSTFYFEHASVGGNIVDGLQTLHDTNASFYQLTTSAVTEAAYGVSSPPSSIVAGTVYEFARGNPGWSDKINWFSANIANTWGGKTTFAMNKFCWIDETADWSAYSSSIAALELANPGTTFVYMTMPLNKLDGADNVLRNQFNTALRDWASTNDKILFDVADIEAYDSAGNQTTFTYDGAEYQRLFDGWASDEGHLNTDGQARVALGFYALGAEFAAIPEPSTYASALGLAAIATVLWRRRSARRKQP